MASVEATFDWKSARAEKARIGAGLTRLWRGMLIATSAVVFVLGLTLITLALPFGWLMLGLAALPVMVVEWWHGELHHMSTDPHSQTIDGVLSGDVLGRLSARPTPKEIAVVAGQVPGGQFLAARFGIGMQFLQEISSADEKDTAALWQEALTVRDQTQSEHVSGIVLAAALIRSYSDHQTLLAHLQLDGDDLLAGVRWYEHIRDLVRTHRQPRRTGGIARDWSFGYIPLLSRFGQNLSGQIAAGGLFHVELEAHREALRQLVETFGSGGRQNAVLVGPAGVGKTTIISAFAQRLLDADGSLPDSLKFRQVFLLDAASLLSAAPGRGELEQLVMNVLGEAYMAKNIIICLDNAQLFFEEGVGSVDLTNVLQPILDAGRLRMIMTMDEQRFLQISQRRPELANSLNRISISQASYAETIAVLQDQLIVTEFNRKVTYMYQALEEAYRLSERYVHELAMPGRAAKLLEAAAGFNEGGLVTASSVRAAIEQTMDIKVGTATDEDERQTLLNLEALIHQRMINQTRAVTVVSDALRRARAGVRNQNRPIGTFLFLGPTGVGKTELAKALAAVYFGGEDRLIRLDLNEYVREEDVARLIADGAEDSSSLTARVMKQPFSVILLDEIEKAHPSVLTTLLQLLDEGILRDIRGREVSFRDAIVISTSNAGAERIREYIERGYALEQFERQITDELISSNQFRPEFLNRFDEIVVFRPLDKPELVQVVDLILAGINKTLALQKIAVSVDDDAKLYLVDAGYDPRLGARPMRRVVQKTVENLVAREMLTGNLTPGSTIHLTRSDLESVLGPQQQAEAIIAEQK